MAEFVGVEIATIDRDDSNLALPGGVAFLDPDEIVAFADLVGVASESGSRVTRLVLRSGAEFLIWGHARQKWTEFNESRGKPRG